MSKKHKNNNKGKNRSIHRAVERFRVWDYDFMLDVEYAMLDKMKKFYESEAPCAMGSEDNAYWIGIAMRCLERLKKDDYWQLVELPHGGHKFIMTVYVNTRNYKRYMPSFPYGEEKFDENSSFKFSLYEEKLWRTYCRIRENYMRRWWD